MAQAIAAAPTALRTLPGDDVRQVLWRFAERYDLQMLVQSARRVARGPVARLVARGAHPPGRQARPLHDQNGLRELRDRGRGVRRRAPEGDLHGRAGGGCGWSRGKADVVYVADAFEVMARLNALLAERRRARSGAS